MPTWYYFNRATNMQLHDLTLPTTIVPHNLQSFIGLGMQFIPIPRTTYFNVKQTLDHFRKDLFTKCYFAGRPMIQEEEFIPKLHICTDWEPKFWDLPHPKSPNDTKHSPSPSAPTSARNVVPTTTYSHTRN